ncbi:helix-turn-helix domain-containing protein [Roseateles cellulosilyticus]|uniref:AraC family transcriptional regulator n=1 Tax=Pelomonas cellulosilytica TaxID=2906762 RepID=A0ABS8XNP1_9BURK|nr:AraC family transcriptional regulator [Pelomonas sp. P8]MCE4554394.1 AraC family transcriptional regulator [Pelomonas sp. P8]
MSVSSFPRHFNAATALSPLQYQKEMRRLHARRVLLTSGASVAPIAHDVGYESPIQLSREYSRAFGLPPAKYLATPRGARRSQAARGSLLILSSCEHVAAVRRVSALGRFC